MSLKVLKFGGTSLADAEHFRQVANIVKSDPERRYVVASAPGKRFGADIKVTDMLYKCYELSINEESVDEIFAEICDRYNSIISDLELDLDLSEAYAKIRNSLAHNSGRDYIASRGEYLNAMILAKYLGFEFVDAAEVIFFDENGRFDDVKTNDVLSARLHKADRAVIPGFYGAMPNGDIKTFSRGGSDLTGSIVAKAAKVDMYENWTDVSGFMIADPRIINNPKTIEAITYKELRELSYMGATVLHEDAIFPIRKEGIPINIRNTNAPEDKGTLIVEATCRQPKYTITGIAGKQGFAAITIEKQMMNAEIGFCRKVLQVFEDNGISIEHMPSGIDTMTVFVHQTEFEEKEQKVIAAIHQAVQPDSIELESDLALIAIVGRGMRSKRGTSGRVFSALAHAHVNVKMIDQGSSELNIVVGVRNHDFENAIKALYDIFVTTRL
jgi:aspartate kinase